MAKNRGGRPLASALKHRCTAESRTGGGAQCGSPAVQGLDVCRDHMGRVSPKALVKTSDRLVALTGLALDRLEEIIRTGGPEVAERACRTILDRTIPRPGAQLATIVNVGLGDPDPTVIGGESPVDRIRKRMLALVSSENEPATVPSLGDLEQGYARQGEPEIVDAEIVEPGPQAQTA